MKTIITWLLVLSLGILAACSPQAAFTVPSPAAAQPQEPAPLPSATYLPNTPLPSATPSPEPVVPSPTPEPTADPLSPILEQVSLYLSAQAPYSEDKIYFDMFRRREHREPYHLGLLDTSPGRGAIYLQGYLLGRVRSADGVVLVLGTHAKNHERYVTAVRFERQWADGHFPVQTMRGNSWDFSGESDQNVFDLDAFDQQLAEITGRVVAVSGQAVPIDQTEEWQRVLPELLALGKDPQYFIDLHQQFLPAMQAYQVLAAYSHGLAASHQELQGILAGRTVSGTPVLITQAESLQAALAPETILPLMTEMLWWH